MTYKLTLIKDNGEFNKWGASLVKTLKTQSFDNSWGHHANGYQSTDKLRCVAKEWLDDAGLCEGTGWVELSLDGNILDKIM